jgi:hypothetical protein
MVLVEVVALLALLQYLVFGGLVARARGRYGVKAPAVTGHEAFERFYRVQMNTLELLVGFLPAIWIAARYWSPVVVSGIGAIYLIGRMLYLRAYVRDPASRELGFTLSLGPVVVLLVAGLVGAVWSSLK